MPFWSRTRKEKDPVCGMDVDPKKAAATQEYQGTTYYFCSTGCVSSFAKEPAKYLKAGHTPMGGMGMGHH